MYVPMFKLENKPLTISLGTFFKKKWSRATRKQASRKQAPKSTRKQAPKKVQKKKCKKKGKERNVCPNV
jgi:hypothetical protein